MNALNTVFFDEFKSLDQLCRDIYGDDATPKLGVTLYLEHMEADFLSGRRFVPNWESDYIKLKCARNMRNEFAHSPDSFRTFRGSQPEIDFVRSFHDRILNGSDPLTALRKQTVRKRITNRKRSMAFPCGIVVPKAIRQSLKAGEILRHGRDLRLLP